MGYLTGWEEKTDLPFIPYPAELMRIYELERMKKDGDLKEIQKEIDTLNSGVKHGYKKKI